MLSTVLSLLVQLLSYEKGAKGVHWEGWGRPHRGEDAGTKFEMSGLLQMAWEEKAFEAGGERAWR